jgi:ParB family transcriptional regulator, chromosome partitioning protein
MAVRKGLGRGLDLLIPKDEGMPKKSIEKNKENKEPKENQVLTLSIHDVEPNRNQPRKQFDEDAIEELADSIKQYGVIQPLIVQKKDKYYEIIAGERRWRACKKAGLKEVPVIIKNYDEKETLKISLIENLQREDSSSTFFLLSLCSNIHFTSFSASRTLKFSSRIFSAN